MIAEAPAAAQQTPDFDILAPLYRWMEWLTFGPFLAACRREFLAEMKTARRALIIGDGDGRFTARLLRQNPAITIDAVDASPAMLRALMRRAGQHASRVNLTCIDARNWQPSGHRYDLIVTHFFLDCLTTSEIQSLANRVRSAAAPQALWVVSDFAIPPNPFGRMIARPLIGFLYFAFRQLTGLQPRHLPDHAPALNHAGFHRIARRTRLGGLLMAELRVCTTPTDAAPTPFAVIATILF